MTRQVIAALCIGMIAILNGCREEGEAMASYHRLAADPNFAAPRGGKPARPASADDVGGPAVVVLTPGSDLHQYLALAAENNPGLQAAFYRWKAALERIPQARALPDPRFTYRGFVVGQAMRDGDLRNIFEVSQEFPWFKKLLLKGDAAALEAQAEQQRFEAERLKLFNRVADAYWEHYYTHHAIAVTQENLQQMGNLAEAARARYAAAAGSQPDVLRAQVEQGKAEDELRSLQDVLSTTAARLNAAINRPLDAELPALPPAADGNALADEKQLLVWMLQRSPELRALEFDIAREHRNIGLARQDYFPDIMVGFEYDQMQSVSGVDSSEMKDPVAILVSMNIPIWWEKYSAGVREARNKYWAAVKDKTQKANDLGVDLRLAAYNFRNAQRKLVLYRDTLLPRARQSLVSYRSTYQGGGGIFSDMLEGQRIVLEFQLAYERAYADRHKALAEIEAIIGGPLSGGAAPTATTQPATSTASGDHSHE